MAEGVWFVWDSHCRYLISLWLLGARKFLEVSFVQIQSRAISSVILLHIILGGRLVFRAVVRCVAQSRSRAQLGFDYTIGRI